MKITVGELLRKIDAISQVINELDKMPECDACTDASQYLDEYVGMLKDIKVDV